ncbi:acyl-CoA dehydrogenase family protein [Microtetraspora sp. NBRC 16547]|uniref:acyl-CoA dehydrogenase family protein n=1 Tax=Microtetraspora sp. NBRC 16547 TaxID=3030993 RepID=UPI0024A2E4E6|nr:acyl-CoA dehydrogenase family protein [Microtetraspora sp. NBRC 16547]GLX02498.1 acyl-CoA dehydrogenase [Microtetraspora sp. NBRC 16547]
MTTPPVSLLYTEVEEELRAAVRALLADACPHAAVLARIESATPYDGDLWKALARDIGAAGLLVPEELGGAGASAREAAVVLEELGRAVAPVPFLTSAVVATRALLAARTAGVAGGSGVADELLERLASGEITAALAVSFAASPYRPVGAEVTYEPGTGETGACDVVVSGRVTGVAGAEAADVLLVSASLPGREESALIAVETREQGVAITPMTSLDLTRPVAMVSFGSARGRIVARSESTRSESIVRDAIAFGAGLLASEQLGLAEWCLSATVEYVKERKQFARPVGSFQALKHRLADLWLEIGGARAAARNAAGALAAGYLGGPGAGCPGGPGGSAVAVAVAQAHCGDVAVHAAEECVQLHGGIGITWEHPAHLYLKRAKADQIAFGTPGEHRTALAGLVDVPAPA